MRSCSAVAWRARNSIQLWSVMTTGRSPSHRKRKRDVPLPASAPGGGLGVHAVDLATDDMPPAFLRWLADNGIDPRVYTLNASLPRYIRRNPRMLPQPSDQELGEQMGAKLLPVAWLPRGSQAWFAMDCRVKIARCEAYRRGLIYGVDASSAAAALALVGCALSSLSLRSRHCASIACLFVGFQSEGSATQEAVPGDNLLDLCCAPGMKTWCAASLQSTNVSAPASL